MVNTISEREDTLTCVLQTLKGLARYPEPDTIPAEIADIDGFKNDHQVGVVRFQTIAGIATLACCSERSTQRAVRALEGIGLIYVQTTRGGSNTYWVRQLDQTGWADVEAGHTK